MGRLTRLCPAPSAPLEDLSGGSGGVLPADAPPEPALFGFPQPQPAAPGPGSAPYQAAPQDPPAAQPRTRNKANAGAMVKTKVKDGTGVVVIVVVVFLLLYLCGCRTTVLRAGATQRRGVGEQEASYKNKSKHQETVYMLYCNLVT